MWVSKGEPISTVTAVSSTPATLEDKELVISNMKNIVQYSWMTD